MVAYSIEARSQIAYLVEHYDGIGRPEAARNLNKALTRAESDIANGIQRFRSFPATYRALAQPGIAWLHEGRYWIAYRPADPATIIAVFWDRADIERRDR